jgi:hypothetical protein
MASTIGEELPIKRVSRRSSRDLGWGRGSTERGFGARELRGTCCIPGRAVERPPRTGTVAIEVAKRSRPLISDSALALARRVLADACERGPNDQLQELGVDLFP